MTRNSTCTELQLVKCKLCEKGEEKLFSNDNVIVHMKKEHLRPAAKTQECLYGCVLLSFQSFSMICDLFFCKIIQKSFAEPSSILNNSRKIHKGFANKTGC